MTQLRPFSTRSPKGALNLMVNTVSSDVLLADLEARLAARKGFSVATINLDHVVKLRQSPDFHRAYTCHTHVVADGNPIVWLERLAGRRVELAPGSELVAPVAALAARLDVPVALLGSTAESLAAAAEALVDRNTGLRVVAQMSPPMDFDPQGEGADLAIAGLKAAGARLVFVALGAPKQEIFAARAQLALPQTGFLSIGAGLDFLSGKQSRAPVWAQKLAVEWLWRMAMSPRRLTRRYGACILVLPGLTLKALRSRIALFDSGP